MGVNFIKKYWILVISKNCKFCGEIKFELENVEHLRWKLRDENFEWKILSEFKLYKKLAGWKLDGWMDGGESGFKDCLQQSKT